MSHWTIAEVKINPNRELLVKTLQMIAEELGAKLAENVTVRGYNRSRHADYALLMQLRYGNGFGISISGNGIEVFGDDHGAPISVRELRRKIQQYYTALAVMEAAKELGFTVNVVQENDEAIVLDLMR